MRKFLTILLWLWQFPQNLVGWVYLFFHFKDVRKFQPYHDAGIFVVPIKGGVSLGKYIFVERLDWYLVCHEYGHCRQSKMLGWFYLLVIGLPSLIWNRICKKNWNYYRFYTERWADKLGGVKR